VAQSIRPERVCVAYPGPGSGGTALCGGWRHVLLSLRLLRVVICTMNGEHESSSTVSRRSGLALVSGGLDSQLAVCVLRDQGLHVEAVTFSSPFFSPDAGCRAADQLGIPHHVVDFTTDILELLNNPPHGFGRRMNPCIDCHARMLKRAGNLMQALGFDFLSTGEVLDQRPMSQNVRSLHIVSDACGYGDVVIRPLSARLLPETRPEREGWVDRSKLLALQGRSRRLQMEMAERYGLTDYPTPAGGCRLTEPNFSDRLSDLRQHEGLSVHRLRDLQLLRIGRHFRLPGCGKIVVGRNKEENDVLSTMAEPGDIVLTCEGVPGPTALLPPGAEDDVVTLAASIVARYSDALPGEPAPIHIRRDKHVEQICVMPALPGYVESLRV
jgi:tRNA-specific 2-thiouridylase